MVAVFFSFLQVLDAPLPRKLLAIKCTLFLFQFNIITDTIRLLRLPLLFAPYLNLVNLSVPYDLLFTLLLPASSHAMKSTDSFIVFSFLRVQQFCITSFYIYTC